MDQQVSEKVIVVTGATSGIGLATAEILAREGFFVIGVGRSPERCQAAEQRLRALHPRGEAAFVVADLSLQSEVRRAAAEIRTLVAKHSTEGLDGLVNNAGTFTYWFTQTAEGFEMQWAVNHLAAFLLTNELLPLLQAAPQARVVTVSSDSHYGTRLKWDDIQLRRSYNGLRAYGQTKLANVLFTMELNRRLEEQARQAMDSTTSVRAFAADPGLVKTEIGFKGTPALVRWIWQQRRSGGIPAEQSARGIAYLVTEPSLHERDEIYWKDGKPKQPSRRAQEVESAHRLWALSAQMCGIPMTEAS